MSLSLYKKKRNFANTPEPDAAKGVKKSTLSFVVQRHHASNLHYDFRLEMEGVLKSWAVPKGPSMVAGEKRLAVLVEDHPLPYGKFYGEIPKGNYGAGTVEIWDAGTYRTIEESSNEEKTLLAQLYKGDVKFIINGNYLQGEFALVRMNDGERKNWLLIKKKDGFAQNNFNIESLPPLKSTNKKKVKPGSKNIAVPKKAQPLKEDPFPTEVIKPMLAKLGETVIDDTDWLYEVKYDGYRAIAKINNGKVEMFSRNGNNFTNTYQLLVSELATIQENIILDGEMVIENKKGVSDFQLLQNYSKTKQGVLKYYIFDLLYLNGHSTVSLTLKERKELLEMFFKNYNFKNIYNSAFQIGDGKTLFNKLSVKGYEGIIAKDPDSRYLLGRRSEAWLKIKVTMMQEVVICGYTLPQNSRKYFGSLILGLYDGKVLKYIGNCGTGFTEVSLKELHTFFEKLKTTECPFIIQPKLAGTKGKPVWLKPNLVCNVKFSEWTQNEHMRVPVFMGIRTDKKAEEVINETIKTTEKTNSQSEKEKTIIIAGKKVKCTNITKVYWPEQGYTKGDLLNYYQTIYKYLLPYLKNRPQSLNRHPNGITGHNFYQKDMEVKQLPDWIKTVKLYSKSNNSYINYLLCNDAATLILMANMGCIEINPWHSTFMNVDEPDYMILDLDPGNISFVDVVDTALVIQEICTEIQIPSYCKTSGATGLHIYIPLGAKYNYAEVKIFAELLAVITHSRLPHTTSIERSVAKRPDKIYIDFLQNRKGQTIAAPYSIRPKNFATVSTPLLWKEVNHKLTPEKFTIKNTEKRLQKMGDLWQPVLKKGIILAKALKLIEKL
ncbi:MAG: DNA ligase D [Bacteroidota bacterium]|nr:DNA ligase D [Bacteroidota bacterium]